MFIHWLRHKEEKGWRYKAVVNAIGTVICSFVLVVIIIMKFLAGAWISLLCIMILLILMRTIKKHYEKVAKDLAMDITEAKELGSRVVPSKLMLPVQSVNRSFMKSLDLALSLGYDEIELYNVSATEDQALSLQLEIEKLGNPALKYVYDITEFRNVNEVLLKHVKEEAEKLEEHQSLIVMMSSLTVEKPIYRFLHNDTTDSLAKKMAKYRNVSVLKVPYIV